MHLSRVQKVFRCVSFPNQCVFAALMKCFKCHNDAHYTTLMKKKEKKNMVEILDPCV